MRLKDKVAIVTGGSQGIGEAFARRFAQEGAYVAIVNRRPDKAKRVVDEICAAGGKAVGFQADVSRVSDIRHAVEAVAKEFGHIDVLLNNAGVYMRTPAETTTEEVWQATVDINLKGPFFLCQAVIPYFKKCGTGRIINIGSIFGNDGFPESAAYCATKGAIVLLTKSLCLELRDLNITVNCIAPGFVETPFNEGFRANDEDYNRRALERFGGKNVWMKPDEVAGMAVFLASTDAASVNGATLFVDRGWAAY